MCERGYKIYCYKWFLLNFIYLFCLNVIHLLNKINQMYLYVACHVFVHPLINVVVLCYMVLNATFNNISVISWWSVLLVEESEGPRENHRPVTSH